MKCSTDNFTDKTGTKKITGKIQKFSCIFLVNFINHRNSLRKSCTATQFSAWYCITSKTFRSLNTFWFLFFFRGGNLPGNWKKFRFSIGFKVRFFYIFLSFFDDTFQIRQLFRKIKYWWKRIKYIEKVHENEYIKFA